MDEQKLQGYSWPDCLSVVQPPSPPGGWLRGKSSWKTSHPGPRPGFRAPCLPSVTPGSSHVFTVSETGSSQEAKGLNLAPAVPPLGTRVIASVICAKEEWQWLASLVESSCASSTDTRSAKVRKYRFFLQHCSRDKPPIPSGALLRKQGLVLPLEDSGPVGVRDMGQYCTVRAFNGF